MNKKRTVLISLLFFVVVGFFLRSYNFSQWLRFNADQARDAKLAINVSQNKEALPLLGPMAGGTGFQLGPIFDYFQIASLKMFGIQPYVASYPDLLFSVLSILIFFFLARIYFNPKVSLALTWLLVVSYFMVKYGRFGWNPNSTPFFVMLYLYSFYGMINYEKNRKILWAMLCGLALGINVQLHTSLLIILPVVTIFTMVLLYKKKKIKVSAIVVVLAFALLVNIPQVISEFKTNGWNTIQFFLGATQKNKRNSNLGENLLLDLSCHAKANMHILSSLGNEDDCGFDSDVTTFKKLDGQRMTLFEKTSFGMLFVVSIIFSLGGYALLAKRTKKEKDEKRKIMLMVLSVYVFMSLAFFFMWATELSVRFFLGLSFVPFLLLGFWISFLSEKFKKERVFIMVAILLLSFFNLKKIYGTYMDLAYGGREINGNFDYATLGEENFMVEFLVENSNGEKTLYLDAQAGYLFKMLRPMQFLAEKYNLKLVQLREEVKLESGARLFYIKSADKECELTEKILEKHVVEKCSTHGQFSIFTLKIK